MNFPTLYITTPGSSQLAFHKLFELLFIDLHLLFNLLILEALHVMHFNNLFIFKILITLDYFLVLRVDFHKTFHLLNRQLSR